MREPCPLPLVALRGDETCPRCGRPAREHRGHPSYQETTMTETNEPTREQIEKNLRESLNNAAVMMGTELEAAFSRQARMAELALRTLDAEAQLAAMTERAEKAERLSATLRAVAEQEVADAIVKSRERATRVGWIDHATGDYEERAVTMLMDDLAAGSAVCAFLRMVGVWTLEDRAEKAERERHVAVSVMREMRVAWDGASDQRNDLRAKLAEVERERDVSRSALNDLASGLRDALGDFPMVGEKWTDAVKRLRARLAEVERERDEERHLATVRGEMLSVYERRIAELSSRGNVIANRVFWIDHVTGDRCEHVTKSTFEDLMHIEAIATAFRMIAFDVIRAKLADAERRLVEVGRELLIKDAQIAEMRRAFGERYARLSNMHRRAQSAESRVAGWCREAIGQWKRAEWWRGEAKRLGWTPDYPELREDPPSDARIDCESSSLLLLSTWARRVMMRPKNRAKGVPSESVEELIAMAREELFEASDAIHAGAPTDGILAELGDAAACIAFAMREIEKRRKA